MKAVGFIYIITLKTGKWSNNNHINYLFFIIGVLIIYAPVHAGEKEAMELNHKAMFVFLVQAYLLI